MTDALFDPPSPSRPALPEPQRERWQPLRLGLVELFHYDSEEFWFRDGHLLLRGNNGTGKSKVLSLTLPLLFDAQLRPSRIEPDGDNGKKMAWNLLMNGYQRRIGYTWIEFGRRTADGVTRYLTLGAGLSATVGKTQVDSWFFIVEGGMAGEDPRIGQDLWLTSEQRIVLTRDRLRDAIEGQGRGKVFENAHSYRRAVDERLFHLGTKRYEALMDTLIQLRQPQLSKKPDEAGLSHALTEALPPMPIELLGDVAEALNQLEEDRIQLEETRQLERAVKHFEQRYRTYAGTLTRRQARELRQAQTSFDNASEERNRAHAALQKAQAEEAQAIADHENAKRLLVAARERLETLQSDPANQDANRLRQAENDANERQGEANAAGQLRDEAKKNLVREEERSRRSNQRSDAAKNDFLSARALCASEADTAGTASALSSNPLTRLSPEELAQLPLSQLPPAAALLREATNKRRENIRHLEQRHAAVSAKQMTLKAQQATQRERQAEQEEAAERRAAADQDAEAAGNDLIDAWTTHCASLVHLRFDATEPLEQLTAWIARPDGSNPIRAALTEAYRQSTLRHAGQQLELETQQNALRQESAALAGERDRLVAGHDAVPLPPATRAPGVREGRVGAPLWQLVDFQPHLDASQRAGLEAALEASGLLDAWLAPDGGLTDANGTPLFDSSWVQRPQVHESNLANALLPAVPEGSTVSSALVAALLTTVAYGSDDPDTAESWITADGRYRLGVLAGTWHKSEAVYIGHTARTRARQRRLDEISQRLCAIDAEDAKLTQKANVLATDRDKAESEWSDAPSDNPLHAAIQAAVGAEREVLQARKRLDLADDQCRTAEAELQSARDTLERDATDLQLPSVLEDLSLIASALDRFTEAHQQLALSAREWHSAWPDYLEQQERETEARSALMQREESLVTASECAEKAKSRHDVLQSAIGAKVETLRQQLATASTEVTKTNGAVESIQKTLTKASETRAVASTRSDGADNLLAERTATRAHAIERLQHFADSSLLASALPDFPLPDGSTPWTIDPALTLARRAEQALAHVPDDDAAWSRIQRQVSEDLTELQRSLSALGHQATSEPNDWGFSVHVIYQNRPERPDTLSVRLTDDIAQRSELLSAKEREVLENHLQAEIAAEIQRLMRAADKQVTAINEELHKRPTSTGVRYRLQWQPLTPEEGAPAGLDVARERLLNSSSDMWSTEDRRVVGVMLQQQIAMERARADADTVVPGGSLIDQLARALDYRRWHRFRVQRQQDGQWRKLSGPASSGERALGLTVPLFAAISSFYGRGGSPHAPRLMLLDEAFAGIDDAARAHCMGLIREFDLDFVITSEREWACYAELPGVSICQLQRREGVDAVFVSRWNWDGRSKRREDDPDRRFPLT
ncbi:MAG: TIGR02680 family protein [Burkholderiaceae bacterium]|nr:TIGR02680 family protein [Burkholderiaceae bacterium]